MHRPLLTRANMFEPLLEADPSFQPRWAAFLAEWHDDADPPLYIALSSLAEHVLDRLKNKDTQNFDDIFAVVERWHLEGDNYVAEAASIGFLESIQNQSGGNNRNGVTVERWLGPETLRWWIKLDRFWEGEAGALQNET